MDEKNLRSRAKVCIYKRMLKIQRQSNLKGRTQNHRILKCEAEGIKW